MVGRRAASYHYKTALGTTAMALVLLVLIFSCTSKPGTQADPNRKEDGIHETIEKGAVSVTLDIDKKTITTAERLHLTVSATCPEAWTVDLPDVDEQFGEFAIVSYDTARPVLTGGNQKTIKRSYILEPFLAGDYLIPPLHVGFIKDEKTYDINTPEISITVTSLLPSSPSEETSGLEINDIKPPLSLPLSFSIWMWAAILSVIVILALVVVFMLRKRRLKNGKEINVDPAEVALNKLEQLAKERLEEKGESKRLYHGVSTILRRYIEQSFGIRAPEQTTEEFLAGLEKGSGFPDKYNRLLKDFLRHCDLVKFAEHQPRTSDIRNTFNSCREFIEGTRERRTDAL